jgi:hypothetical protein
MPAKTRIDAVLEKLPPEKGNALHSICREYGIYDDNAAEILFALVLVEVDDLFKRLPAEMRQEVELAKDQISAVPELINQAIDDRLQAEKNTLTAAIIAANQTAIGKIEEIKNTFKTKVEEAVNAGIQPSIARLTHILNENEDSVFKAGEFQRHSWRDQYQALQTALKELKADLALINRITDADKQAVVQVLADWQREFADELAASGSDAITRVDAQITSVGAELLTKTNTALKAAETAYITLGKKYATAVKKQEEVLSRANRYGLAVLGGLAVLFLSAGILAGAWWQMNEYQTTLSQTIQFYEGQLPKGSQMLPAGVVHDAEKLRAYLATQAQIRAQRGLRQP